MKLIKDQKKLEEIYSIQKTHFQKRPAVMRLLEYEKGELLTHPLKPLDQFLIICEGNTSIYNISNDGQIQYVCIAATGTLLGDMEFSGENSQLFYTEAAKQVLCLSIPFSENRETLENDPTFLRYVLHQLSSKLFATSAVNATGQTLEEKLLLYLKLVQPDHKIQSVNSATQSLRCSRRHLQRVLKNLCDDNKLKKIGRGTYILSK